MSERLHKLLAQHGLGSRRAIEQWMLAGRVLLNGRPAQPGDRWRAGDRVVVDGKDVTARLRAAAAPRVIIYNKPQGQPVAAVARDSEPVKTVMESLPSVRGVRWLIVNAMQPGDSGLLVVTTDGRLADALRRRAGSIAAAYAVRVLAPYPEFDFDRIPRVVQYDEDAVEFEAVEPAGGEGANRWFHVEARHAHRRAAVRALFESRGLRVSRVIQVRFGGIELPRDLPRGRHLALPDDQTAALYDLAGLPTPALEDSTTRGSAKRPGAPSFGRKALARRPKSAGRRRKPTGSSRPGR